MKPKMRRTDLLLLAPALAFLVVFLVAPLILLVVISFQNQDVYMQAAAGFSADRYVDLLTTPRYLRDIGMSLLLAVVTTLVTLVLAYPTANLLVGAKSKGLRSFLYIVLVSPLLTSVVVRSYAWVVLLSNNGLVNQTLEALNLIAQPLPFMWNLGAVVVACVQVLLPYMVLPIATSLRSVSPDVRRASTALGAGRIRTFFKVTLPLTAPGAVNGGVIVFSLMAGSYITAKLVGGSQPLLSLDIYTQALQLYDLRMAAAMAIVLLVVVFIVVLPVERALKNWEVKVYG